MRLSSLEITFHRTVRVPEGRQPANLPPSLGRMELFRVSDYKNCPKHWEKEAFFVALHDTEAMWMSFSSHNPAAILVGAGGINALTGQKLGTKLEKDNYLVAPPQPWLDGWKDKDGTVYQFVATPYKKGEGITVAEQLIGKESKTGAIGIAVFDPKDPSKLAQKYSPTEGVTGGFHTQDFQWKSLGGAKSLVSMDSCGPIMASCNLASSPVRGMSAGMRKPFAEMGVGKGGKIIQKIYPDPHGLAVWKTKPSATLAIYLVNAFVFEEITGNKIPVPVGHETYDGPWFGLDDKKEGDVAGSNKFTGLKSAVFPASDLNEVPEKKEKKEKKEKVVVTK